MRNKKLRTVDLFATTGRLIKSINREELPATLPDIISYGGNFYVVSFNIYEYAERAVYLYEEKPLTTADSPTPVTESAEKEQAVTAPLDTL